MSEKKQKKTSFEDDDMRVIAPMNVEGMPWYAPKMKLNRLNDDKQTKLSDEEERIYRRAALRAGLMIGLIYGVCGFLLILILLLIWR